MRISFASRLSSTSRILFFSLHILPCMCRPDSHLYYACWFRFVVFRRTVSTPLNTFDVMWFVLVAKISVCMYVHACWGVRRMCLLGYTEPERSSQYSHIRDNIANKKREYKIFTLISDFQAHFENPKHHHFSLMPNGVFACVSVCVQCFVSIEFTTHHTIKQKTFARFVLEQNTKLFTISHH